MFISSSKPFKRKWPEIFLFYESGKIKKMFHTQSAYYISSLKEWTVMRNYICNSYAQTFFCEKYM
jgi:hypothetical protein